MENKIKSTNIIRNLYGEIVLNINKSKDSCSLCKYRNYKGDHNACFSCAYDYIGIDYYYK